MCRDRLASALAMVALAAILLPSFVHAQITFQRTYGGAFDDYGNSVQQNTDSGYVVAGLKSTGVSIGDFYLIRTDAAGNTLWSRTYNYWNYDAGYAVLQTTDGGFVFAGQVAGNGNWYSNLVWTDAQGNKLGDRVYDDFRAYSLQQTADGGYVIAGTNYYNYDVGLIRTNGSVLWRKSFYGHPGRGLGYSAQQTADSGYIETGFVETNRDDVYLVKTNTDGDTLWTRTFGGDSSDWGHSVRQTTDGGYVIAGWTKSFGAGSDDVYLIRTDTSGDTMWTKTYGGTHDDEGYSVQQTADSGFIIVGYTESFGAGGRDVYLIKTNTSGDTMWTRTFGGANDDEGYSVWQTTDGGYTIAGYTKSYGAGGADVWLIKTDADGHVAVAEPMTSPTRPQVLSLCCEPNPSSGTTTIRLSPFALRHSPLTLRMYDSQGRMVLSREVSTSSFPLSTSGLPSGAYFIRCDAAGERATARIVLQR